MKRMLEPREPEPNNWRLVTSVTHHKTLCAASQGYSGCLPGVTGCDWFADADWAAQAKKTAADRNPRLSYVRTVREQTLRDLEAPPPSYS
jgi:hypothetical protein